MNRQISAVLVLASAFTALGCNQSKERSVVSAAAGPPSAAAVASYSQSSDTARLSAKPDDILAYGPIVVENQLDVAAQRDGVIATILVDTGMKVHKGELLGKLDDRQISADAEAAAAKVRALEANLENWRAETKVLMADRSRAEKLYDAQVISKEELDHTVYKEVADEYEIKRESESLNNAKDVLASLQLEKEKTKVLAPFDGVVARRYVRVGQKVAVGDRLLWVTAMGPLQVRFTGAERLFGKLRQGTELAITSADVPRSAKYAAKVVEVSPVVDPSSGTVEILAQITDADTALRPGMLVNISLNPQ
jgi:RND family efflux transporter MFP subunit